MSTIVMTIDGQGIPVEWEDNTSVQALKDRLAKEDLIIKMSEYGGFEQVGSLGMTLLSQDVRQVANPGDIMLYTSSNIVIYYGTNHWAFTKLGRVSEESIDLTRLLARDNVTLTLSLQKVE